MSRVSKIKSIKSHPLYLAVGTGTEAQLRMGLDVVRERKLLVLVAQHRPVQQRQHEILRHAHVTPLLHALDLRRDALPDLDLEVHRPAVAAEGVLAGERMELVGRLHRHAHRTELRAIATRRHGGGGGDRMSFTTTAAAAAAAACARDGRVDRAAGDGCKERAGGSATTTTATTAGRANCCRCHSRRRGRGWDG